MAAIGSDVFTTMLISTQTPANPSVAPTVQRVSFKTDCSPYHAGEAAAFLPADVTLLVGAGLAVRL